MTAYNVKVIKNFVKMKYVLLGRQFVRSIFHGKKNVIQTKIFHHRNVCIKTYNQMRRDGGGGVAKGAMASQILPEVEENQKQRETSYVLLL